MRQVILFIDYIDRGEMLAATSISLLLGWPDSKKAAIWLHGTYNNDAFQLSIMYGMMTHSVV